MLNYIWAGLIVLSFAFAVGSDALDLTRDTYRNGSPLPVALDLAAPFDRTADEQPATLRIDAGAFRDHYGADSSATPDSAYAATLRRTEGGYEVRLDDAEAVLPAPLDAVRDAANPRDKVLQGRLVNFAVGPGGIRASGGLAFAPVRFVKLTAITAAALDMAETAATLALGLIGVLVLFLGLTRIAEDAGIVRALVHVVRPLLRPLFPDVPPDHPALGMIALNLAANVFGLGNAATPFGIKAMEELQTLNPNPDTASDAQVMLLTINTASVQLVPPVLLVALIGLEINAVYGAIVLTTFGALAVGIVAAKVLARSKRYRLPPAPPLAVPVSTPDPA
ncbi:MAG TPA: nucleoside recognition domain-containing protein [Rubricoccaceae bacterium]|jgi:spore maturation protein A